MVATNQWFLKYYSEFKGDQGECPPKTGLPLIFVVGVESMSLIHFVLGLIIIAEVNEREQIDPRFLREYG